MPQKLSASRTISFVKSSLREITQWIQEEQRIPTLFDSAALAEESIPLSEPVSNHLDDEPVYRLSGPRLAWYVEDEILHITTVRTAARMSTQF